MLFQKPELIHKEHKKTKASGGFAILIGFLILLLKNIQNDILYIQAMLDRNLAELYKVETRVINQSVNRNINRFPENFRFQLTEEEYKILRSQFVTSSSAKSHGGRRYRPYVFTEQGIAMLSAVLRSDVAINVSI